MRIGENFEILHPQWLWLLILMPVIVFWMWKVNRSDKPVLIYPFAHFLKKKRTYKNLLKTSIPWLMLAVFVLLVVAMSRPRSVDVSTHTKRIYGVDIVLAVDVSGSMLAKDFKPNRLEALKRTAIEFIKKRPNDRFGLVLYAGEAFTRVPLTSDHHILIKAIKEIDYFKLFKQIEQGTAIGMGLATAVNRIKDSQAKSKVIILMTDGVNNTGAIDPQTALELAKQFGIKVYTIGIGTNGIAPFPILYENGRIEYVNQRVEIDEKLLKKIARETGGKYYRASDNKKLKEIYDEIDKLEKSKLEVTKYYQYKELFRPLLWSAVILLFIVWILRQMILKGIV